MALKSLLQHHSSKAFFKILQCSAFFTVQLSHPYMTTGKTINSILKRRDTSLPKKVCIVRGMVFPVVMYGYESWTVKKAEHQRIDAFELWCWRRLLRSLEVQGDPTIPFHSQGDQSWVFFGRNDAKAETPILWPPHAKS